MATTFPTLDEANALLRQAEADLAGGKPAPAVQKLARVLMAAPDHPQVLQLHAVALRGAGRPADALHQIERALKWAPADSLLLDTRGTILGDLARHDEALAAHEAAIAADAGFGPARLHRALTLQALERWSEADEAYRAIGDSAGAAGLVAYAAFLRAQGDPDEAALILERALALEPGDAAARHARLSVALDRGEPDALEVLRIVQDAEPAVRPLLLDRLAHLGDRVAAERVGTLLAADPGWNAGRNALALWLRERHASDEWLLMHESQLAARPKDAALWRDLIGLLAQADDYKGAADAAERAGAATGDPAFLAGAFGYHAGSGDAEAAERLLARPEVAALIAPVALAKHRLAQGDAAAAEALLAPLTKQGDDVDAWAMRGIAWQMMGDPRWQWLNGQPGLVAPLDLSLSAGEIEAIRATLAGLHDAAVLRLGQSVRGGTQTLGNLFHRLDPPLRRLEEAIREAVQAYRTGLPVADPTHPLLRHRDEPWAMPASWSVRLRPSGFHVSHIHPKGIVSSASYWELPPADASGDPYAGWLELGRPPAYLGLDLAPIATLAPAPGRLILFPSTLHHGTRPFASGTRITAAFDLAPA